MAEIILSKISKRYGEQAVVDNFDLQIADGEFVVLVGPSGCGKSTTLRMIAGLEDVSSGSIQIGKRDVTQLQPSDRNIAMVFQNYALYPHKTVYENLAFGLRMRKVQPVEIENKVRWAAEMLGIGSLLERKPRQLSGGQMQRVSLGRALVRSPEAFLLDEPLSNLDAKLRVKMREEIAQLHKRIATNMIYVTHDQVEAMTLGDRIVIMNQGRIQQVGKPLEVYDAPTNLFVASFIGAPEMNFIKGELRENCGKIYFNGPNFSIAVSDKMRFSNNSNTEAVLGIRPEHVALVNENEEGISAVAVLVEQMGPNTLTILNTNTSTDNGMKNSIATPFRVLTNRRDELRIGNHYRLQVDPTKIHLFEAMSGKTLAIS